MHQHEHDLHDEATSSGARLRRDDSSELAAVSKAVASRSTTPLGGSGGALRLQRLAGNAATRQLVESDDAAEERSPVLDVVGHGRGEPLPEVDRAEMESHFGTDFGDVRVHTDGAGAASATAVQARAYTVGNEVVFNEGAYAPGTEQGRRTLAHELTHVIQQRSGPVDGTPRGDGIALSDPSDRHERAAEAAATSYIGGAGPVASTPAAPSVQREAEDEGEAEEPAVQRQDEEPEEEEEPAGGG